MAGRAAASTTVCYVPGMAGANDHMFKTVPKELAKRGIRFVPVDVGRIGLIQERAKRLAAVLHEWRTLDPQFRCHFFAHSLGGLTVRYALTRDDDVRESALSYTSFSSPHRGTPAADVLRAVLPNIHPGLEQVGVTAVARFDDAANASYSPLVPGLEYYSYRTYLGHADNALEWTSKVGFVLLWQDLFFKGLDPLNDGLIPLSSQGFGKVISDVKVEHAYFGDLTPVNPPVTDFFEMHANYVSGGLDAFKAKKPKLWKALKQTFKLTN